VTAHCAAELFGRRVDLPRRHGDGAEVPPGRGRFRVMVELPRRYGDGSEVPPRRWWILGGRARACHPRAL